jgi:hypothetical protein
MAAGNKEANQADKNILLLMAVRVTIMSLFADILAFVLLPVMF